MRRILAIRCFLWYRLPPKVQKIHDETMDCAQALQGGVGIPDDANPEREARVLGASRKAFFVSNMDGERAQSDVKCSCGVPRVFEHP
jgi:hypothetical protein